MRVRLGSLSLFSVFVLLVSSGCRTDPAPNQEGDQSIGDTRAPDIAAAPGDSLTTVFPSEDLPDVLPAHDFSLPGLGGEFTLSAHRGEVVVLNFWATWNEPSIDGMEAMDRVHAELGADGIAVVGIAQDEGGLDVLRDWADAHGVAYPLVADASRSVARQYGEIELLPTTIIIDRHGLIRERHTGILTHDELLDLLGPILIEEDEPLSGLPAQEVSLAPQPLSPMEVHRLVGDGAMLVDVRSRREVEATGLALYAEHLPLHAMVSQDLPANLGVPVIFLGESEDALLAAVRAREWGYFSVYIVAGGLTAWEAAGLPVMPVAPKPTEEQPLFRARTVIG